MKSFIKGQAAMASASLVFLASLAFSAVAALASALESGQGH